MGKIQAELAPKIKIPSSRDFEQEIEKSIMKLEKSYKKFKIKSCNNHFPSSQIRQKLQSKAIYEECRKTKLKMVYLYPSQVFRCHYHDLGLVIATSYGCTAMSLL